MAAREQINVEIDSRYDDKGAKQAKADLKAIDGTSAEATIDADVGRGLADAEAELDAIDGRTATAIVDADVGRGLADAEDTLDDLDGRTATATVDADVGRGLADAEDTLDDLDGRTATATVDADVGRGLTDAEETLDAIDGRTARATVDASIGTGLTNAEGELDAIDGRTARATVDANIGTGLTNAEGELDAIDGRTVKATVDADATTGATTLFGRIGGLPGAIAATGTNLTTLAAVGGPIAAVGTAFFQAAEEAGKVATEAQQIADLSGASVEKASALQAVLRDKTNIEAGDLADILAQVTGALEQNPALLRQLGIEADTVRQGPFATFVAAVDAWNSGQLSANDKLIIGAQLFGEEGLRQVNSLTTALDTTLADAIAGVAENRIIHPEDVVEAKRLAAQVADLKADLQGMALTVGQVVIPAFEGIAIALGKVKDALPGPDVGVGDFLTGGAGAVQTWVESMAESTEVALEFEAAVRAGRLTTEQFNAIVEDGTITADELAEALGTTSEAEGEVEEATASLEDRIADLTDELEDQVDAQREAADASEEQADALRAANDVFYANQQAVRDARDAVDDYNEVAEDGTATADDQAEALQNVAIAADEVALSEVEAARRTAEAAGASLSHTEALDIQNDSLLAQAANLDGPMREAVVAHIARLNGIPPEVVSDILALIDQGKYDEAEALLAEVSRTRDSTVRADADNASVANTEATLAWLSRPREVEVFVNVLRGFGTVAGVLAGMQLSLPAPPPAVATPYAAAGGGDTYNLNLPRGTRIGDTVRELDRHARRNGRRPYAFRR